MGNPILIISMPMGKSFRKQRVNTQFFYCCISDQVIYPGKVLNADCFRIGNIGYLMADDIKYLLKCIEDVCAEMNISIPIQE